MTNKTRILILEDLSLDVDAVLDELRLAELSFEAIRADTKDTFLQALKEFEPDVILSDYRLPQFNALDALDLLKKNKIDTPFILYTNSLDDEIAVECMKRGAADYIPKSKLENLPPAVINVLKKRESHLTSDKEIAELRQSEHKLRTLLESMSEALLEVGNGEVIEFVNDRFCEMTGYERHELLGKVTFDILFDEEGCQYVVEANNRRHKKAASRYELRLKKKNGETLWTIVGCTPIMGVNGKTVVGTMRVFTDITERKNAEEQLLHDAFHDALTGLANRTLFMHHLRLTIERRKTRNHNLYAVLFLDFDRFKVINDSLGHAEGDKLLKFIARRLEACVRTGDLVARLGGDEFVILLTDLVETGEALLVAERIQNDLKQSFNLGTEIFITTSIGIALSTAGHEKADDMLRDADVAMYHAKARGKAQYQVFDQAMHGQAVEQLQFETDMRHALERNEFRLYYQPIVNLETNNLVGFEALVRWHHPTRGVIAPKEFIPTAEENRLILPLGKWILHESCRQLREWQNNNALASALMVSVNLSCKQFLQFDLAEQVAAALRTTGLAPNCLKLEITESHIMENTESAIAMMNRLRDLGIEISLDDFGTGYSSLSYLHRFPVDYLKIDRSFVNRMMESKENGEIVHTIIKLAQNLKMKVIAEGVETVEQLTRLNELNCEYGQGFLFAKPLEPLYAENFINENLENPSCLINQPVINLELNA